MKLTRREFFKKSLVITLPILTPSLLRDSGYAPLVFDNIFNNTTVHNDDLYFLNEKYYKKLLSKLKIEEREQCMYFYYTDYDFNIEIKQFYTESEINALINKIAFKINNKWRHLEKSRIPSVYFVKTRYPYSDTKHGINKNLFLCVTGEW